MRTILLVTVLCFIISGNTPVESAQHTDRDPRGALQPGPVPQTVDSVTMHVETAANNHTESKDQPPPRPPGFYDVCGANAQATVVGVDPHAGQRIWDEGGNCFGAFLWLRYEDAKDPCQCAKRCDANSYCYAWTWEHGQTEEALRKVCIFYSSTAISWESDCQPNCQMVNPSTWSYARKFDGFPYAEINCTNPTPAPSRPHTHVNHTRRTHRVSHAIQGSSSDAYSYKSESVMSIALFVTAIVLYLSHY